MILAADLRGFTAYPASHDGGAVVERLNAFFDILVAPIVERGGEVLKFTGDGLLAMLPFMVALGAGDVGKEDAGGGTRTLGPAAAMLWTRRKLPSRH